MKAYIHNSEFVLDYDLFIETYTLDDIYNEIQKAYDSVDKSTYSNLNSTIIDSINSAGILYIMNKFTEDELLLLMLEDCKLNIITLLNDKEVDEVLEDNKVFLEDYINSKVLDYLNDYIIDSTISYKVN